MSKRIVFFGNERLATGVATEAPTLNGLIDAGYDIVAVVSNHSGSRSRKERKLEIQEVAERHNIPVFLPGKPMEIYEELKSLKADIGVLVAYGKIVPQAIMDIFPRGIVNVHPSLLPLHRGPTPIESVILDGSTETGVSLMQLVKAMDAGPVFAQTRIPLSGYETKIELVNTLLHTGKDMLIDTLPPILDGSLLPNPQDEQAATYDSLIDKQDGVIDWRKPAVALEREIRAYAEWPKSTATIFDKQVTVTAARVAPNNTETPSDPGEVMAQGKQLLVQCGKGVLVIEKLKPAGKSEMDAAAFLAGYKK